ncbi:MAG: translation initiation factor IF-2 [Chloroflexi bacterium]|nr:translation initiation factor IF-2 [Chloroflexota bacterium]
MKRNTRSNRPARPGTQSNPQRPAPEPRVDSRQAPEPASMDIELPAAITVRELADLMRRSPIELIKELMNAGVMANINQQIDYDTAAIVAEEMGFHVVEPTVEEPVVEEQAEAAPVATRPRREYSAEEVKFLRTRPPVVTILGHVDHGKTSLLDVIRRSSVQASEVGGITQHIGAYQVDVKGQRITFLDTPGHEAFAAMRARGASVTDIAVLVVAADDGVQPQTREAIAHARAAQVPIVVAINKMDLAAANPDHVKQQLSDLGLVPEDWGGETICVPVSARTKAGIDVLLDTLLIVAEMADLKANPRATAEGVVVEGRLDRARGAIATLLLQEGTLEVGDTIVVGTTYGRIRAMFDYTGAPLAKAGPSTPAVVMGLREVPAAGDTFTEVANERRAREIVAERIEEQQAKSAGATSALTLDEIFAQAQAGKVQSLNLILKADVQGSLEPIRQSLEQIEVKDLSVTFVHEGVGNVAESDVQLAVAANAVIIGFSVGVDASAERLAAAEGVDIRLYDIIYRVIEDVEKALTGMLEPEYAEVLQGRAVVRQVYRISRVGIIAGSQVTEGRASRSAIARIMRNGELIHRGRVSSLKRFTEDVREVAAGLECGIGVDGLNDLQEDDVIEFYTREIVG